MLESLPPIAEVLLSSSEGLLTDAVKDASVRAGNTLVPPHEPSTLALALVGIATLAIYFAASGLRQSRRNVKSTTDGKSVTPSSQESVPQVPQVPKRGAA